MRIVVIGSYDQGQQDQFRTAAGSAEVIFGANTAAVRDALPEVDGVVGSLPDDLLAEATRLRWLHSPTAGVDKELTSRTLASDVVLTSSAGNGGIPLAEHSMLLMLMLNRNVPRWIEAQRNRTWDRFTHGELNGLTVGIVGLGNAGADLALKAQAFHMRVLGLRRRTHLPTPNVDRLYRHDEIGAFLADATLSSSRPPAPAIPPAFSAATPSPR